MMKDHKNNCDASKSTSQVQGFSWILLY